ncbi:MAG TPA: hypothetical protein VFF01_06220 [Candidatus Deferrimicrobiaceae bacterium]|nr:hypothetical protein [Candidatus Deferrimicrobiaceae bacterium]
MKGDRINDPIGVLAKDLGQRGIPAVRERFRVPAFPQISPCAGFLLGAAGAFLLASGHPDASFLVGIAGALLLVLYHCGFSPLDWMGPREMRSVLVVPGTPAEEHRKALFVAVPLFCRLTSGGVFSRRASLRRSAGAVGLLLCIALPLLAGAASLHFLTPLRVPAVLAGAALSALAAAEWVRGNPAVPRRNLAAEWAARSFPPPGPGARPYLLLYPADEAEVKFFLAKYRRHVLRGQGIFVEFAESSAGPPAVTIGEGPFFLPYRVDPALFSIVRAAGDACGVHSAAMPRLRFPSGGLVAMSRGFAAVTLFRMEAPAGEGSPLSDPNARAWLEKMIGEPDDLTEKRKGV